MFAVFLLGAIEGGAQTPTPTPTGSPVDSSPAPAIQPLSASYRFPVGQTLVYEAEWRLFTAGTASLRVENVGSQYRVYGTADSTGAIGLFYRVYDRFQSNFDARSLCSSHITKHTEEGSHKRETNIRFDYGRRKAVLDERNLKTGETKHQEFDIPGCATDVLSGIFYASSLPLQVGQTYYFPLNDGNNTVNVKAHVEAREEVKTPAGTFQALRVQPEGDSGVLRKRGRVWIWYSDDAQHIPVQMKARLFWGSLMIRLVRIEKAQ